MEVNQSSKLMQLYEMQNLSNSNKSTSSDGSNPIFSILLEEMMKNTSAENSSYTSASTADGNGQTTAISGLQSLTVDPQRLSQMMQISSMQSMLSSTLSSDIGSVSSDDSSDQDGMGSISSQNTDMSQLLNNMLESIIGNQYTSSTTSNDSSNMNSSNQLNTKEII